MRSNPAVPLARCPFCGGAAVSVLELPEHQIVACLQCHIARTEPPPQLVDYELGDFHGVFSYRTAAELPCFWRRSLDMQRDLLRRHLGPGARILEIGCGRGLLLRHLRDAGFDVSGIEPSRNACKVAVDDGLHVRHGYFSRVTVNDGPFDAVVASHVLEHIEEPGLFIDDIAAVAPRGLLLLVQANWRGWVPRKNKGLWHAWAQGHHYWHFTPPGMSHWLEGHKIKRVELEYSSLEHGTYWLARVAQLFPRAGDQFHLLSRLP